MRTAKYLGCILAVLSLAACGYKLRGTGNLRDVLPANVKKISVQFKNLTTRFELDKILAQAVIGEFVTRGTEIVSDPAAADATLAGDVAVFNASPAAFSAGKGAADRYTITVVTRIELKEARTKAMIYSNPAFPYTEDYEVPQGTDFDSVQTEAIKKIAVKFARQLVITILEGF
jgi:outer membrane lipopolysaccharide assembly protein LptE/RlpB